MGAESMRRSASCLPATAQDHEACAAMSEDCLLEGEKLQKNLLSGTLSGALPSARGPYSARSLGFSPSRRFSCDCGRPPNRALPLAVGSKNAPRAGPQSSLSSSARWNSGARLGPLFRSGGPEAALRATGLGGRRRRSAAYFSASPAPGHPKPPTSRLLKNRRSRMKSLSRLSILTMRPRSAKALAHPGHLPSAGLRYQLW